MSRRDYVKIAKAIAEASESAEGLLDVDSPFSDQEYIDKDRVVELLVEVLGEDNADFDAERFQAACRGEA